MKIGSHRQTPPHIPVIALADIAWQIIIFFLVASSFTRGEAFLVDLPAKGDKPQAESAGPITLVITQNAMMVNDKPVDGEHLEAALRALLEGRKGSQDRAVVVQAHSEVSFQRHLDVMYTVQKSGGVLVLAEEQ
jgi:biopolymer transport protein ExbD